MSHKSLKRFQLFKITVRFFRIGLHQLEILRQDLIDVIKRSDEKKVCFRR